MKKLYFIFFFVLLSIPAWSCPNASLFKVFPIGVSGDTIVSIDFWIYRSFSHGFYGEEIDERSKDGFIPLDGIAQGDISSDIGWEIKSYITKYDKHQNPLEITPAYFISLSSNDCDAEFKIMYSTTYEKVLSENKDLRLFQTKDFDFCAFNTDDENLYVADRQIIYQKHSYTVPILNDSTYYGFSSLINMGLEPCLLTAIGTVRTYSIDDMELIVVHGQFGQQLGGDTDKPDAEFKHVADAAYMEPILYHGLGIDYFIIRKNEEE